MPKAAVDKYGNSLARENNIWTPWQILAISLLMIAEGSDDSTDNPLRFRVSRLHSPHDVATFSCRKCVHAFSEFNLPECSVQCPLSREGGMRQEKGVQCARFLKAKGDPRSHGRKSYSAKHLVGARGLGRLRFLLPRAGQFLDLSFWARACAMDGSNARVLWKAPYRRNSHALGDVRIAGHSSLFVYALPASPAAVRACCQVLDDRHRHLIHHPGSSYLPSRFARLQQFVSVNRAACRISNAVGVSHV